MDLQLLEGIRNGSRPLVQRRAASISKKPWQRPTLPQSLPCSTIGPEGLYFRVRDGNGCYPFGIAARKKNERSANADLNGAIHVSLLKTGSFVVLRTATLRATSSRP